MGFVTFVTTNGSPPLGKLPFILYNSKKYYQIVTFTESGRTIASPSWQPHAALNSGMLLIGPFTRYCAGECGSVTTWLPKYSSVWLEDHTCPQPIKMRCCQVYPSITAGSSLPST